MDRLLDPKNDWAFKQVFGQEKHKNILIAFLNAIFENVQSKIVDVQFLKVETDSEVILLRQSIVDVLCRTVDGRHFIVEMQRASDTSFVKRAVEYACRVYLGQRTIDKKKKNDRGGYGKMRPVIFLAIMEETLFAKKKAYLSHHQFRDIVSGEHDIKLMSFSFLELSKFHKTFEELDNDIDRWAYYFKEAKHISPEELDKVFAQGTVFGEAYKVLEKSAYTPDQLLEYTRYELKEEEIETRIYDAKVEGIKEGERIGIEKAEAKAYQEKIESARKMLRKGVVVSDVADFTGLSLEEVRKLQ